MFPDSTDDALHFTARFDEKPEPAWESFTSIDQVADELLNELRARYRRGEFVLRVGSGCYISKLTDIPDAAKRLVEAAKAGRLNNADRVRLAHSLRHAVYLSLAPKVNFTKMETIIYEVRCDYGDKLTVFLDIRSKNWTLEDPRKKAESMTPANS